MGSGELIAAWLAVVGWFSGCDSLVELADLRSSRTISSVRRTESCSDSI